MNSSKDALIGPYQIAFDITNHCNYRCLHCYNASGENSIIDNELSDDEIINFISDVATLKPNNFCFCGGEPLLRLPLLLKCADILHNGGISNIALVSNGYYVTEDVLHSLSEHHVNGIQISLDGATEYSCFALRQNTLAYERATNALRLISSFGNTFIPSVAFCPTNHNVSELESVFQFCCEQHIRQLRVQPLMIIGRASKNNRKIIPSDEQYIELVKTIHKCNQKPSVSTHIDWGDPLAHIFDMANTTQMYPTFMSVKANGALDVSPYLPLAVGNIRKHSIIEYWNAGFVNIWSLDIVKEMAAQLYSVENMAALTGHEASWYAEDQEIDIIDDIGIHNILRKDI